MLVVTITSNSLASRTSSAAIASMIFSSHLDLRITRRNRARAFQEQPVGHAQHVRLVHARDVLAASHREAERFLGDAHRGMARDLAHRERQVGGRHELARALEHVAIGVKPFRVLAHHHEIDRLAAPGRKTFARLRRSDVGEQVEPLAQRTRRIDSALVGRRIVVVRHRSEMMPSAAFAISNASRERRALRRQRLQPDLDLVEANSIRHFAAAARSTPSVAAMISGEMPSPCMTQRRSGEVF